MMLMQQMFGGAHIVSLRPRIMDALLVMNKCSPFGMEIIEQGMMGYHDF